MHVGWLTRGLAYRLNWLGRYGSENFVFGKLGWVISLKWQICEKC